MGFTRPSYKHMKEKKLLLGTTEYRSLAALCFLLIIGMCVYLPFVSTTVLGERDAYRVAVGLIESIRADQSQANALLYGLDKSFAYFTFLNFFSPLLKEKPDLVIPIMNYVNAIASIFMIIPFYLLVRNHWGITTAILANLVLMSIPVWNQTSLYGHPMVPAVASVILGLFLVDIRSKRGRTKSASLQLIFIDFLIVSTLSLGLMLRLDSLMIFLLIPGLLLLNNESYKNSFVRSCLYIALPIFIFFAVKSIIPGLSALETNSSGGFLKELLFWHNLSRFKDNLIFGSILFIKAFNPLFLLLFGLACFSLIKKRKYDSLCFILPLFLFNYLFWIPNPSPARHFIYAAPPFAIAIAIVLKYLYFSIKKKIANKTYVQSTILFSVTLLLIVSNFKRYEPPFYESNATANDLSFLGRHLERLEKQEAPIFVIGDVIPTLQYMQASSDLVRVSSKQTDILNKFGKPIDLLIVNNGINTFVAFAFFHADNLVVDTTHFLEESDQYKNIGVFIDPTLEIEDFPGKTINVKSSS
ncbi:MAG: hypothetical protein ACFCU8_10970 [Thermosynechococcaceae cyanobacterium]